MKFTKPFSIVLKRGKLFLFVFLLLIRSKDLFANPNQNCHSFYFNTNLSTRSSFDLGYEQLLDRFDLNFTKMTDPNIERMPLALDLSEGLRKRLMLKRLGLDFNDPNFRVPTFRQFLKAYTDLLNELKVPENERIYPTIALIKGSVLGNSGYKIKFVTPGKDPWPQEDGYRIFQIGSLTDPSNPPQDPFNIPRSDMILAHQNRKFPLLAFHDIAHFISFVLNKSYTKSIIQSMAAHSHGTLVPSFHDRLTLVLEYLSLGNPDLIERMKSEFKTKDLRHTDSVLPQSHFTKSMNELDEATLVSYSLQLGLNFTTFMRDYGGGTSGSREKGVHRIKDPVHALEIILGEDPSRKELSSSMNAPYRNLLLGLYNAYHEIEKNPTVYDDIIFRKLKISNWQEIAGTKWSGALNSRDLILVMMRKKLAILEGFLWNSSHIPIEEWVGTFLNNRPIDESSRVIQVFRDYMSEDSYLLSSLKKD